VKESSPARLYALIFGAVLLVAGVVGFFYESEFTSDESVREAVFGLLDVNGWHNVVHLATGLLHAGCVLVSSLHSDGRRDRGNLSLGLGAKRIGLAKKLRLRRSPACSFRRGLTR